jgi:hypothetical protein
MMNDSALRSLIRLLPPARALKEQLEKSLHLEMYSGTGDVAISSLNSLKDAVATIASDAYIIALSPTVPEGAGDREKVSVALLIASQLLAYIEGETGLSGTLGGHTSIQTAPNVNVNISSVEGVPNIGVVMEKALNVGKQGAEGG